MDTLLQMPYKIRTALLLTVLICVILINNTIAHRNFDRVKRSVAAIYNDRLLAATYIFEITDLLYQERLQPLSATATTPQAALTALIAKYEATRLIPAERTHWLTFKSQLTTYQSAAAGSAEASTQFNKMIPELRSLAAIQTGEGNHLFKETTATVSMAGLYAYLEFAVTILIGIITIILIGVSKKTFAAMPEHPSLN